MQSVSSNKSNHSQHSSNADKNVDYAEIQKAQQLELDQQIAAMKTRISSHSSNDVAVG